MVTEASGQQYVLIDLEHGGMSDAEMHTAIHSIAPFGVSPIVRLPSGEAWLIKRALDAGAHGIAVPMVSTPVSQSGFDALVVPSSQTHLKERG